MCLSAGGGENRYQSDWELPPGSEKRQTAEDEGRGSRVRNTEGEENFVGDSEIIALGGASNETKDRPLG